ncbi:hypothetical protein D9756_000103 [Leucocoprinus leucothites]|uniref:Ribosomal RNA-processing protein 43 n=1 Tax=Leucocoprinus leucothites TaxID=201217 RepID=A0A8H5GG98_9AGAR|nr:hypothetical protein D9756_000103 [Leucoagaricus leucothites]
MDDQLVPTTKRTMQKMGLVASGEMFRLMLILRVFTCPESCLDFYTLFVGISANLLRYFASAFSGSINTADGSALVRMGGTTIVCGVKAEIAEPDLEKPDEGFLVPNIDLPAMCHPRFKPGPPSDEAQVLSERLYETLASSNFISPQSLVIQSGKAAWTLYVDATCINYDGNVFDAALIAMMSALMNAKLPRAVYDEELGQAMCYHEPRSPLIVNSLPLPASFGIFDSAHLLADPTAFEEPLMDSTVTIITGEDSASKPELLNVIQQGLGVIVPALNPVAGPDSVVENALGVCIRAAKARRGELAGIIREAVKLGEGRKLSV